MVAGDFGVLGYFPLPVGVVIGVLPQGDIPPFGKAVNEDMVNYPLGRGEGFINVFNRKDFTLRCGKASVRCQSFNGKEIKPTVVFGKIE